VSVEEALGGFPAVSLDELDRRASLLRRTDTKYVLTREQLDKLLSKLASDHEVLEIEGRRAFSYESVYFDTPDLRCFRDHVDDQMPRFKARTRLYRDTGHCVFEVKLKSGHGETDKRQIDHPAEEVDRLNAAARQCLEEALGDSLIAPLESPLRRSLVTRFTRFTLAPAEGSERVTCDRGIVLERPGGGSARLSPTVAVVETKSENGGSPADRAIEELGVESLSLSKYRTGIALLVAEVHDPEPSPVAQRVFEPA
jgi:VTC domain